MAAPGSVSLTNLSSDSLNLAAKVLERRPLRSCIAMELGEAESPRWRRQRATSGGPTQRTVAQTRAREPRGDVLDGNGDEVPGVLGRQADRCRGAADLGL